MSGFGLHPEAIADIDEIATCIGADDPAAAHRMVDEIYKAISSWYLCLIKDNVARNSPVSLCASSEFGTI